MINVIQVGNKIESSDIVKAVERQKKRELEKSHISERRQP